MLERDHLLKDKLHPIPLTLENLRTCLSPSGLVHRVEMIQSKLPMTDLRTTLSTEKTLNLESIAHILTPSSLSRPLTVNQSIHHISNWPISTHIWSRMHQVRELVIQTKRLRKIMLRPAERRANKKTVQLLSLKLRNQLLKMLRTINKRWRFLKKILEKCTTTELSS